VPYFHDENVTLHYLERGCGEPILLIHGLACSGADWAIQVAALEKTFRVIVPDLPGFGHSSPPRGEYAIQDFASVLWRLLDHLKIATTNIVGFSLGGAVALEMTARRPAQVRRLGLINSLASYRPDRWSTWFEKNVSAALVRLLGMQRAACVVARRLFPQPWQNSIRRHAAEVMGAVPAAAYLGAGLALARWSLGEGLKRRSCRSLVIAAEHDFTPLPEKLALAARLGAEVVVVRGSRHGTPFDSTEITNASLLAFLDDQPLPPDHRWVCDGPALAGKIVRPGTIADEHALSPLLLD
jgi:pimeloyl-ACP methyl ester carboxylesterase